MKKLLPLAALPLLLGILFFAFGCEKSSCNHEDGVKTVVAATCESEGYVLYQCKECDYSKKTDITPATEHSMSVTEVAPTCQTEGYNLHKCANCSFEYHTDIQKPVGHSLQKSVTEPTCLNEGYTSYVCTVCDFSYRSDTVAPKGHTLSQTVVAPTCIAEGYTSYACTECTYIYKGDFAAPAGHKTTPIVTPPTCTEEGHTTYTCACGYSYIADVTSPTGHSYTESTVAPSCTEGGYTVKSCTACEHSLRTDFVDPLGHDDQSKVFSPACDQPGYTQHVCARCQYTYRAQYLSPLGHSFALSIAHPTRTAAGAMIHTCDCGYEWRDHLFYSDVFTGAYAESKTPVAKGVDVSEYQHTKQGDTWLPLDWQTIKNAGIDYAILKVGSTPRIGLSGKAVGGLTPTFEMDYRDAKAAGVQLGAYFYIYSTTPSEALADANRLISWLDGKQFEYPIYLDLEDSTLAELGKDTLTEICTVFLSALQEKGYYAALYCNQDWLSNRLHKDILLPLYDIWYARPPLASNTPISSDEVFLWNTEKYGDNLGMWQYSHHGVIEGIDGIQFDLNYAYRDYPTLIKKYGYNGFFLE